MTSRSLTTKAPLPLLVGLLLAVSLLAGCLGGGDDVDPEAGDGSGEDGDAFDGADGSGDEDPDGGTGAEDTNSTEEGMGGSDDTDDPIAECVPTTTNLSTLAFSGLAMPDPAGADPEGDADPAALLSETVDGTFTVDEGTTELIATATHGAYVTLGWSIVLTDPEGTNHALFDSGPDADPTAESDLGSKTIPAPVAGTWEAAIVVAGYIEDLQVAVDAEVCA